MLVFSQFRKNEFGVLEMICDNLDNLLCTENMIPSEMLAEEENKGAPSESSSPSTLAPPPPPPVSQEEEEEEKMETEEEQPLPPKKVEKESKKQKGKTDIEEIRNGKYLLVNYYCFF